MAEVLGRHFLRLGRDYGPLLNRKHCHSQSHPGVGHGNISLLHGSCGGPLNIIRLMTTTKVCPVEKLSLH